LTSRRAVGAGPAPTGGGGARGAAAGGAATTVEPTPGGVAVAVARDVPQKPQSRNFEGVSSPQFEQKTVSGTGASAVPQNPHSLNRAGFAAPHDGQATVSTSGVY